MSRDNDYIPVTDYSKESPHFHLMSQSRPKNPIGLKFVNRVYSLTDKIIPKTYPISRGRITRNSLRALFDHKWSTIWRLERADKWDGNMVMFTIVCIKWSRSLLCKILPHKNKVYGLIQVMGIFECPLVWSLKEEYQPEQATLLCWYPSIYRAVCGFFISFSPPLIITRITIFLGYEIAVYHS